LWIFPKDFYIIYYFFLIMVGFQEKYHNAIDMPMRIEVLQQEYGLEHVKIQGEEPGRGFVSGDFAEIHTSEAGYHIVVRGRAKKYQTLHAFLRIWLTETGRTFDPAQDDEKVAEYLFELRNMFDNYLAETEVQRRFGPAFSGFVTGSRTEGLQDILDGIAPTSTFEKMMYAIECKAVSRLYPQMKGTLPDMLVGKSVTWANALLFFQTLEKYASASTVGEYQAAIRQFHNFLTDSDLTFKDGKVKVAKPERIADLEKTFEAVFMAVKQFVSPPQG
jgi:hypothetical protein